MRLMQAMRDKIDMYDKCINALTTVGHEPEPDTPAWDMVYFLEEERNRVRNELKELEDGTHEVFGVNSAANTYTDRPSIPMRTD